MKNLDVLHPVCPPARGTPWKRSALPPPRVLRRRGKALLVYEPPTAAGLDVLSTKLHRAIVASGWRMIDERRREPCIILTAQPNVVSESPADNPLQ